MSDHCTCSLVHRNVSPPPRPAISSEPRFRRAVCSAAKEHSTGGYKVGQVGPGGGIVFYVSATTFATP